MRYIRKVLAIASKDLRTEARRRDLLPSMIVFAMVVIVIFNFVFAPELEERESFAPGVLLVVFTFTGMLGLSRSFAMEREQDAMRGLLLAPVDRSAIYLGKLLSNLFFLSLILAISLVVLGIFFNLDVFRLLPRLGVVLALTVFGFVAVGTLYAAIATNIRLRELLLPILLFPVNVPLIIASVGALGGIFQGKELSEVGDWLKLLAAYDVIFIVLGMLTFEFVVGE